MKKYVSNAFSFNMFDKAIEAAAFDLLVTPVNDVEAFMRETPDIEVSIGNQGTCDLFNLHSGDFKIFAEKRDVNLQFGDQLLVMQYNGPRLEQGLTKIPDGGSVRFYVVEIHEPVYD